MAIFDFYLVFSCTVINYKQKSHSLFRSYESLLADEARRATFSSTPGTSDSSGFSTHGTLISTSAVPNHGNNRKCSGQGDYTAWPTADFCFQPPLLHNAYVDTASDSWFFEARGQRRVESRESCTDTSSCKVCTYWGCRVWNNGEGRT